jgi:retron-type reverse transcriptase
MVSFDVVSLFTNIPIVDSLELLSHHFEDDVLALFKHVLTTTYVCFDGQFYEQTEGVAMGSPLSPVIANFFMEDFEKNAIEQATHKPVCWFRYVDDTFVICPHGQEKLEDFSELPQWTPQQDTVYNGKRRRRPPPIPGH